MRVLMISTDRGLFEAQSATRKRHLEYANRLGGLSIIVFSRRRDGLKRFVEENLECIPTNSFSPLAYSFDAIRFAQKLGRFDVVSAQDPFEAGVAARHIARKTASRLHIQVHTDMFSPYFKTSSLINRIRLMMAPFTIKKADHIRVVSERLKIQILARFNPKANITVLPIFVDVLRFKNLKRVSHPNLAVLLWVGRFEREKDPHRALEAFAKVYDIRPSTLIMVGSGRLTHSLQQRARDLNLVGKVQFMGSQDAAPYYALGDLLLVTSRYEGYGLVIVEALAAGLPVLSLDVGVAQEAGATVVGRERFSEELKKLLSQPLKKGSLRNYPYFSKEDYLSTYIRQFDV